MWQVTEKTVFDDSTIVANLGGTVICIEMDRPRDIFSYNVYSEVWRKYTMPSSIPAPENYWNYWNIWKLSYCVLGRDLFVFGGLGSGSVTRNDFWQLTYNADGRLIWVNLCQKDQIKSPSPRVHHLMWDYGNKVFCFGGVEIKPATFSTYLPDSGEHVNPSYVVELNNQLLQYDVATGEWTDVISTGDIPSPSRHYSCARIRDTVYMYHSDWSGDPSIYKLDLGTFHWTKVEPKGSPRVLYYSFTAIDCERIVLYGGVGLPINIRCASGDIWVLDVTSNNWTKHDASGPPRHGYSAIKHPNSDALLVFRGIKGPLDREARVLTVSTVQLSSEPVHQPKSLWWHALKAVDRHRERTGLSGLPKEFQKIFLLPGEKVSGLDD